MQEIRCNSLFRTEDKTKTLLSAIWEKGLIIEDIAQWGRSYCLMMLAESWGK